MKLIEAARVMASARRCHKREVTIMNVDLAVAFELCEKKDAAKFCRSLGLYANGTKGHTDFKLMAEHIKRTGQSS